MLAGDEMRPWRRLVDIRVRSGYQAAVAKCLTDEAQAPSLEAQRLSAPECSISIDDIAAAPDVGRSTGPGCCPQHDVESLDHSASIPGLATMRAVVFTIGQRQH